MNEEKLTPVEGHEEDEKDTSSDEELSGTDISAEETEQPVSEPEKADIPVKKYKPRRYRAPLIIAACIFAATILFFCGWKCFFDTDIKGCWRLEIQVPDSDKKIEYNFTFEDDNVMRYQTGGYAAIGRYYLDSKSDRDTITFFLTNGQNYPLSAEFDYQFSGNVFTGRTLSLTDRSGFFFAPDGADADESTVESKKKITDSVKENNTTYYIWNLKTPAQEKYDYYTPDEEFKEDKELTGTWVYKSGEAGYDYTFTFNSDGTFEQRNHESEIHGVYRLSDGKCKVGFYSLSNQYMEGDLSYSFKDGKLVLGNHEFTRTDDKYAYKSNNPVK